MARRTNTSKSEAPYRSAGERLKDLYPRVLQEVRRLPRPTRDVLVALEQIRHADNNRTALDGPSYCELLDQIGPVSTKALRRHGLSAIADAHQTATALELES